MSTRGCAGMVKGGVSKIAYNHSDSYPEELGVAMLNFVKTTTDEDKKPTKKQIAHCLKVGSVNLGVSKESTDDWYCLLRNSQFGFKLYKNGLKYMIDAEDFFDDALFCEWGYVIDLANKRFNVYQGGRRRVASIPLEDIRKMTKEDFISMAKGEDNDNS